jgi:hypothetical protein
VAGLLDPFDVDLTFCNTKRKIDVPFFDPPEFGEPLLEALDRRGRTSDDDAYPRYVFVAVGAFGHHRLRFNGCVGR